MPFSGGPPSVHAELARLQPVVYLNRNVYVTGGDAAPGAPVFVNALEEEQPLRLLGPFDGLAVRHARLWLPAFRAHLRREMAHIGPSLAGDPLDLYLWMTDRFDERQCAKGADAAAGPPALDVRAAEDAFLRLRPPRVEEPCLIVGSQFHRLCRSLARRLARGPVVLGGGHRYTVARSSYPVDYLEVAWEADLRRLVRAVADHRPLRAAPLVPAATRRQAQAELAATGAVQRGALVYIRTAPDRSPLVGHVLPAHYDRHVWRQREAGEIAVTHPIDAAISVAAVQAWVRTSTGWARHHIPTGICLGSSPAPSAFAGGGALGLPAFLRWCAMRCSGNGAWHEQALL